MDQMTRAYERLYTALLDGSGDTFVPARSQMPKDDSCAREGC